MTELTVLLTQPREAILAYESGLSGDSSIIGIKGVIKEDVSKLEELLTAFFGTPITNRGHGLYQGPLNPQNDDPTAQQIFANTYQHGDFQVSAVLLDISNRNNFLTQRRDTRLDSDFRSWDRAESDQWHVLLRLDITQGPPEEYSESTYEFIDTMLQDNSS